MSGTALSDKSPFHHPSITFQSTLISLQTGITDWIVGSQGTLTILVDDLKILKKTRLVNLKFNEFFEYARVKLRP